MEKMPLRKRMIIYGDSNTFGYDPQNLFGGRYSEEIRWADIISKRFSEKIEIIPRGMNGRTIPSSTYEIESVKKLISGFAPISWFSVMLGTNDILLTESPNWKTAYERMRLFLSEIESSEYSIVLINPPIVFPGSPVSGPFRPYEENAIELSKWYKLLAEEQGYILIDAASWYVDLAYDGVHLSEDGSLQFADCMAREIEMLIL